MVGGFEDEYVLEFGSAVVEDLFDLEGHGLSRPERSTFVEPAVNDEIHAAVSEGLGVRYQAGARKHMRKWKSKMS